MVTKPQFKAKNVQKTLLENVSTIFAKRYEMAYSTVAPSYGTITTISMSPWLAHRNKGMKVVQSSEECIFSSHKCC